MSAGIEEFFKSYNIIHKITAPYHPESNGMAERVIKTIKNAVNNFILDTGKDWKKVISVAVAAYNMVPHRGTGFSPFMMVYGREAISPVEVKDVEFGEIEDYDTAIKEHIENMILIHEQATQTNIGY